MECYRQRMEQKTRCKEVTSVLAENEGNVKDLAFK